MSKTTVAAKSPSPSRSMGRARARARTNARATSLVLALVVGLELTGVYAFSQGPGQPSTLASADGNPLNVASATPAAPAPRMKKPKVEVSIVAQADMPAH
jgi:uncharacterized protein YggE